MLLKSADNKDNRLAELQALLAVAPVEKQPRIQQEIVALNMDIRREAITAQYINYYYEKDENWIVFHDLWLEAKGLIVQIDLLMINRSLDCYIFDTKHFNSHLKITEEGDFLRWNDTRQKHETIPSPLVQHERNLPLIKAILSDVFSPERVGKRIKPSFNPYVLMSQTAFIERPKRFDTRRIIQSDQLKAVIEKGGVFAALGAGGKIDADKLIQLGQHILSLHRPVKINYRALFGMEDVERPAPEESKENVVEAQAPTSTSGPLKGSVPPAQPTMPPRPPAQAPSAAQPSTDTPPKPRTMRLSQADPSAPPKAPPAVPPMPPKNK